MSKSKKLINLLDRNERMITVTENIVSSELFLNQKDLMKITENKLLNYALHYAKLGFPVLPLYSPVIKYRVLQCSCSLGIYCDSPAKHPRTWSGHKNATTNEKQIRKWWTKHPNDNIGILTGRETGIFVLDVDWKNSGEYSLEELQDVYRSNFQFIQKEFQPLSPTLISYTGSGGRHLYFKHPEIIKIKGSDSKIGEGLDVKGENSYIIAPPSRHINGLEYRWFGVNTPVEKAPDWLIFEILTAPVKNETGNSDELPVSNSGTSKYRVKVHQGTRNSTMMSYIYGLVNNYPKEEVLKKALRKNEEICVPPLPERSIERTVNSAWKKVRGNRKYLSSCA
jgi:putative DNA primase/helicase